MRWLLAWITALCLLCGWSGEGSAMAFGAGNLLIPSSDFGDDWMEVSPVDASTVATYPDLGEPSLIAPAAAFLPNGRVVTADKNGNSSTDEFHVYDSTPTLLGTQTVSGFTVSGAAGSNFVDRFIISQNGVNARIISSDGGTVHSTTSNLTFGTSSALRGFGISADGNTLYYADRVNYSGAGSGGAIRKWNLGTDSYDGVLVAMGASTSLDSLVQLPDFTLLAVVLSGGPAVIRHYALDGTLLGTWTDPDGNGIESVAIDANDASYLMATANYWNGSADENKFWRITVATMATASSFTKVFSGGPYDQFLIVPSAPAVVLLPIPLASPASFKEGCAPQSELRGLNKGNSGCNNGGVGRVQQYHGPFDVAPVHADPSEGESLAGKEHLGIEPYIEIAHRAYPSGDITLIRRALVDLAHHADFDGGLKQAGLLAIGDVEHSLGHEQGGLEAATVDLEFSDVRDRTIRTLLETEELALDEVRIKIGTDAGAAALTPAQSLLRASIQSAMLSSGLRARLKAVDVLFAEDGPFGPKSVYPRFTYVDLGASAPNMPQDVKELPIPSLFGEKSDLGAVDPITGEARSKGLLPGAFLGRFTFEDFDLDVPETDGKTWEQLKAELQASHDAGTLVADYGARIGMDDAAALQALPGIPGYNETRYLIGGADMDDLLAEDSTPAPSLNEWGVLAFGLGPFFQFLSVHGSDLGNGNGDATHDRTQFDLATRAGSDLLVPGWPNWPFDEDYIRFTNPETGRAFDLACILVRGPILQEHLDGVVNITANAIGRMGENGLPIVDVHHAEQVWYEDDILNSRSSGDVVSAATYPKWQDNVPKVKSSTFAARQAYTATAVGGRGLTISWYPTVQKPVTQWASDLMRWTESRTGIDHNGQIVKFGLDEAQDLSTWPRILHERDLFGEFTLTTGEDRENVTSGVCDWDADFDTHRVAPISYANLTAIGRFKGVRKLGDPMENDVLVETSHLLWVLQSRAIRLGNGTTFIEITGRADWLDYKLGQGVRLTTEEGTGGSGFVDRPCVILRRRFNVRTRLVTLTLWDVHNIMLDALYENGSSRQFLVTDDDDLAPIVSDDDDVAPLVLL